MSNARVLGNVWIKHDTPMKPLRGHSDQIERRVWFKSEPLTREFCQVSSLSSVEHVIIDLHSIIACDSATDLHRLA
jgi:hypothetical protein